MSIHFAAVMPHPAIIIPEIGRSTDAAKARHTTAAADKAARRIVASKPDTIVFITPHNTIYTDYIHISSGENIYGDFDGFGAKHLNYKKAYDNDLIALIEDNARRRRLPAGTRGASKPMLDHGCLVPLYFIDKYLKSFKIVRISISDLPYEKHYELGWCISEAADTLGKRVAIVASGDLSHKLSKDGPYGYAQEGPRFDRHVVRALGIANFEAFFNLDEAMVEAAAECGLRSFIMMAGALAEKRVKPEFLCYEGPFGVGYAVCCYEILGKIERE